MVVFKKIWRKISIFLVNHLFSGTRPCFFELKRKLLNSIDSFSIGEGSKVVGPVFVQGSLCVGTNCWIGKNLRINGNGTVVIGDNCDVAPEVTFQTGGHKIGGYKRRAGEGISCHQSVGAGTWIGVRATIVNNVTIGAGCVVAACACVVSDAPDNSLLGGVPAKIIRMLD